MINIAPTLNFIPTKTNPLGTKRVLLIFVWYHKNNNNKRDGARDRERERVREKERIRDGVLTKTQYTSCILCSPKSTVIML